MPAGSRPLSRCRIVNGLPYRQVVTIRQDKTRIGESVPGRGKVIINQRVMGWRNYLSFENPAQARRLVGAHPHQAFALICGL